MREKEINLIDYWRIIWKRRMFIVIIVLSISIIAAIISLILPKWYKAAVVIMPPVREESRFGALEANLGAIGMGKIFGGSESHLRLLAILKSRSLLEAMNKKFNFQKRYQTDNLEATLKVLRNNINIKIEDEEQIIVSVLDKDQEMVPDMANYVAICLDSLNISLTTSKARSSREFIEKRIEMVTDSLNRLEIDISKFMHEKGIISITDQMKVAVEKAADFKAELMLKEVELEVKKRILTMDSPEVQSLKRELLVLRSKFSEFYSDKSSEKLFINFEKIPEVEKEYLQLKRKAEYYTKLLEYLGPQYEQAKIEEARDVPTVQVLDKATRPEKKDKPKRKLIVVMSFILAVGVSIFIVIVQAGLSNLSRSIE